MDAILATIVAGGQAQIQLIIEVNKKYIHFYINLVILPKPFDSGFGQYAHNPAHHLGSMDSSNPHHWRGTWLHHHGGDVLCVFFLCVAVSLVVCRKGPEHNLKVLILPYYEVNRHYVLTHIGMHHTIQLLRHSRNPQVFQTGSSMSFVYLVIVSFVSGLTTPLQTSSMLMLC
jgi:hypothetical protein